MFIETPSSYSFPSPHPPKESLDTEDQLCLTFRKASLEYPLPMDKVRDQYRPYVILEMDHPAQRYHTSVAPNRRNGLNGPIDFRWSMQTQFQL